MNMTPKNQLELFEFNYEMKDLIFMFDNERLPTKIMLSGRKGLGKSTLAYHLINYFLSKNDEFAYDIKNFRINENNRSYKLMQNGINPNFDLIDILPDKKNIDIKQIRDLILKMNKSSFNAKPRFILIDNIEYLNTSSTNALLKNLEEPNQNIHFILIKSEKSIPKTLQSRCLNFNIYKSNKAILNVIKKIFNQDVFDLVDKNLLNYYFTPGKIYNLIKFSDDNNIDIKSIDLKNFLKIIIDKNYYRKDNSIKYFLYDFIEYFIISSSKFSKFEYYNYFIKRINDIKKFNLDEESFLLELNSKLLNE